jgi:cell division protein FtsB
MKAKLLWVLGALFAILVVSPIIFSHHGLIDLLEFRALIKKAEVRVAGIENETQQLKTKLDLLQGADADAFEYHMREKLGWVRSEDLVYFEASRAQN